MTNGTSKINIHMKGSNIDLTPAITEYVFKKMQIVENRITNVSAGEILAEVEVGLRSRHHKKGDIFKAEINMRYNGKLHRAVAKKEDMFVAIDDVVSSIERSVRRSQERKQTFVRRGASRAKDLLKSFRGK